MSSAARIFDESRWFPSTLLDLARGRKVLVLLVPPFRRTPFGPELGSPLRSQLFDDEQATQHTASKRSTAHGGELDSLVQHRTRPQNNSAGAVQGEHRRV